MSVNWGRRCGDLTGRTITGSENNSLDLTQRTEGRTITKVMGGVEKKRGKVTEKINCANSKDNHSLKVIKKNQCAINRHPSLLDSLVCKQEHTVF